MAVSLSSAAFVKGVSRLSQLPVDEGLEVAFAGRSNAGKSSAINKLVGSRGLARTSKTPGRTREINFFTVGDDQHLVDLPGYGYAKVSKSMQARWGELLEGYLESRRALVGVVVIMDIRRPFTDLDCQLVSWCVAAGLPVHALLTKSDKLSRSAGIRALKLAEKQASAMGGDISLQRFSALDSTGLQDARKKVESWLEQR